MKNLLLLLILAVSSCAPVFQDDMHISSPTNFETVSGIFTLKVERPVGNPAYINAAMTLDVYNGPSKVVWTGRLNQADNYTTQIDTTGFTPGQYDISVSYFFKGRDYDEDIEVFVK